MSGGLDGLFVGYFLVFAASALACVASLPRIRTIPDADTRHGLAALLAASGLWAASSVAFLLAPSRLLAVGFYLLGLTAGLTAVGAWLYFCSAYTGRTLHRNHSVRRVAIAGFLTIMALKLINPANLYYTTATTSTPFTHLAVQPQLLHWLAMALSYALAFVGYFMLLERFHHIDYDTRPLILLVSLTALPAILDVVGVTTPYLVNISYEPIGVAAFAVGVLYIYLDAFRSIQLTSDDDIPAIYLDEDRHIREYNRPAQEMYPTLDDATGHPIAEILPTVAAHLDDDDPIIERHHDDSTRYYRVSLAPFIAGETRIGELVTITDVTEREQYRRELERKTEQLDSFASVVAHDLRNPLSVANGYLDLVQEDHDIEELAAIGDAHDRMEAIIEDLLTLAREGQDLGETESLVLADLVEQCWQDVETAEATLVIEDNVELIADASRLQQLLENLFRNAIEHAGPDVTVTVGSLDDGFYVEDDGPGIPPEKRETVFEAGVSTTADGTGFGLSIVTEVVTAHDWHIEVTDSTDGGARFEITNVDMPTEQPRAPDSQQAG